MIILGKDIRTLQRRRRRLSENLSSYAFLLPWLIVLFVFTLYPFVEGLRMSLYDYGIKSQTYVGLNNFRKLLQDEAFLNSIIITLKMCAIIIPGTIAASLLVA